MSPGTRPGYKNVRGEIFFGHFDFCFPFPAFPFNLASHSASPLSIMVVSLPPVRSLLRLSLDLSTPVLLNSFAILLDHIQSPSHLRALTLPDPSAQIAASFSPSLPLFKCQLIKKLFPNSPVVMLDCPSPSLYSVLFFTI